MTAASKRLKDFDLSLAQLKAQLVTRSLLVLTAIVLIGFTRVLATGWLTLDTGNIVIAVLAVMAWSLRNRIAPYPLASTLLLLACSYATLSLMLQGLASAALPVFVAATVICTLVFGSHITLVVFVFAALAFIFSGFYHYLHPLTLLNNPPLGAIYFNWAAITISSLLFIPLLANFLSGAKVTFDEQLAQANKSSSTYNNQYDPLTGLPVLQITLDRLRHELDRSKRSQKMGAVMMIDVDDFNSVHARYGNDGSDMVLRTLAARISSIVRAADTVSRIGGDEFVAIFADQDNEDQVRLIARKILAAVNNPIVFNNDAIQLHVSIGIALYPSHSVNPQELLSMADQALEMVKTSGGDSFRITSTKL